VAVQGFASNRGNSSTFTWVKISIQAQQLKFASPSYITMLTMTCASHSIERQFTPSIRLNKLHLTESNTLSPAPPDFPGVHHCCGEASSAQIQYSVQSDDDGGRSRIVHDAVPLRASDANPSALTVLREREDLCTDLCSDHRLVIPYSRPARTCRRVVPQYLSDGVT